MRVVNVLREVKGTQRAKEGTGWNRSDGGQLISGGLGRGYSCIYIDIRIDRSPYYGSVIMYIAWVACTSKLIYANI